MLQQSQKRKAVREQRTSIDKAANLNGPLIFAVGNAPTALIRLHELITEGKLKPALIIGVPVGFVNVVQDKRINHGNGCALYRGTGPERRKQCGSGHLQCLII